MLRLLCACLALVAVSAPAAAQAKGGLNKAGYWEVEALDGVCAAGIHVEGGAQFVLMGVRGEVTFLASVKGKAPRGKTAELATDAWRFDFEPTYDNAGDTISFDGVINARAVAALRLAQRVGVLIDGKPVVSVELDGTGFEEALDGVMACSEGESGFWGEGAKLAAAAEPTPKIAKAAPAEPELAFNKEGYWLLAADDAPGVCRASGKVKDDLFISFYAGFGKVGFAVESERPLYKGRKGLIEVEGFSAPFKPSYAGKTYFITDDAMDSQTLFVVRRAKAVRITVDGREIADLALADTGFDQLIADAQACSEGKSGWWGKGAALR